MKKGVAMQVAMSNSSHHEEAQDLLPPQIARRFSAMAHQTLRFAISSAYDRSRLITALEKFESDYAEIEVPRIDGQSKTLRLFFCAKDLVRHAETWPEAMRETAHR